VVNNRESPRTPYVIILFGLLLFGTGMVVDLAQHGIDFLIGEFQESPLAHILPAAGIALVIVGTLIGWRRASK
jgi:thiosulfate reductase cytochrome b subunit